MMYQLFFQSQLAAAKHNLRMQVVLTAPLARYSGTSVAARNKLLLIGFMTLVSGMLLVVCFPRE